MTAPKSLRLRHREPRRGGLRMYTCPMPATETKPPTMDDLRSCLEECTTRQRFLNRRGAVLAWRQEPQQKRQQRVTPGKRRAAGAPVFSCCPRCAMDRGGGVRDKWQQVTSGEPRKASAVTHSPCHLVTSPSTLPRIPPRRRRTGPRRRRTGQIGGRRLRARNARGAFRASRSSISQDSP